MKYLKNYEEHNEGIKSGLTKLGIAGSLLLNSPDSKGQYVNHYNDYTNINNTHRLINTPKDNHHYHGTNRSKDIETYEKMDSVQLQKELKDFVRKMKFKAEIDSITYSRKDDSLSNILKEIQYSVPDGDTAKFNEMFNKLYSHMKNAYGYEIPEQKIEPSEAFPNVADGLSKKDIFALMGWLGSILLASCGIPQAWTSYKDKHSHGISWAFLLLWAFGEVFAMIYVYDKLDIPMMMNYGTNILILAIMIYYKIRPGSNDNSE